MEDILAKEVSGECYKKKKKEVSGVFSFNKIN